jgi:hypothetical protein
MEALIVGGGAVGQVLGLHLKLGGAHVSFLVKPKYAEAARRGFRLRPLQRKRLISSLSPDGVLTSPSAAARHPWDVIFLCVSSPALRSGRWLDELAAAPGLFVAIQPGLDDPAYVAERVGSERLVWGMFPLVAFADGEVTSYYRPPLGKLPFSGARAAEVVAALRKGKLPARVHRDVPTALAFTGPLLDIVVAALECAGFELDRIGPQLPLALVARRRGKRAPWLLFQLRPWMVTTAISLMRRFAPFSVDDYLRAHYTKVGDQTAAQLATWTEAAAEYGLPCDALAKLQGQLQETRQRQRRVA